MYKATTKLLRDKNPLSLGNQFSRPDEWSGKVVLYKVDGPDKITPMDLEATPI
jgi:hypothetical protein